jgi:hypothetical protein
MADKIIAWCCGCKSKQEMKDIVFTKTKKGVPMAKGKCPVCKTKMCRIGVKE